MNRHPRGRWLALVPPLPALGATRNIGGATATGRGDSTVIVLAFELYTALTKQAAATMTPRPRITEPVITVPTWRPDEVRAAMKRTRRSPIVVLATAVFVVALVSSGCAWHGLQAGAAAGATAPTEATGLIVDATATAPVAPTVAPTAAATPAATPVPSPNLSAIDGLINDIHDDLDADASAGADEGSTP